MFVRLICFVLFGMAASVTSLAAEASRTAYGNLPLVFEPNQGQSDRQVRFLTRGNGYGLFLTDTEAVLAMSRPASAVVRMRLAGQNPRPRIIALDPEAGASHYFRGGAWSEWRSSVPHFSRVEYRDVYPGVDLQYYGNQQQLEYDFRVGPHSNPSAILLEFAGVKQLSIDANGDLILDTAAGRLTHRRPVAYQEGNGERQPVEARFVLRNKQRVGFEVGAYDRKRPLIIDPVLVYSSYFGGASESSCPFVSGLENCDQGNGLAVDSAGNAYITGFTTSTDFPSQEAAQPASGGALDGFLLKLDPTGKVILSSTYFGGSGDDEGHRLALDGAGNIHITGYTTSSNFPIVNGVQRTRGGLRDAYLLKLNNSGSSILYSTYLGGSEDDQAYALTVDSAGNAFLTGTTSSPNFPLASAIQSRLAGGLADAFITKYSPSGSVVYSTYLGGRGNDLAYDIARDDDGNAYITGFTTSVDFPMTRALRAQFGGGTDDAFIAELNPSGNALVFSTYWGGSGTDNAVRLTLDSDRNIYVTGTTASLLDFPTKNALQPIGAGGLDVFLIKLTPSGADTAFSTFLGGEDNESAAAIAVGPAGDIYLAGFSNSFQFYVVNAVQGFNHGNRDAYVMKVAGDGAQILYSTYLGGSGNDGAIGLAVDAAGNAYVTGYTTSADFPLASEFQAANAGGQDGFITKINADDIKAVAQFIVPAGGGATLTTSAQSSLTTFGYAAADVATAGSATAGLAIIDLRQAGLLRADLGLPLTPVIQNGRFPVEISNTVNVGLALVNTSTEEVTVQFDFTKTDGTVSNFGSLKLEPGKSHSGLLSQEPFNINFETFGAFSFTSTAPISATAFRTNSATSAQLLLSYIPIVDVNAPVNNKPVTVPEFTDGSGWSTQILLVNPTEEPMNGEVQFFKGGEPGVIGHPVSVNLTQGSLSFVEYFVAPRSAARFQTSGLSDVLNVGYFQVVPFGDGNAPAASAILSLAQNGIATLDTIVEGQKVARDFTLYVDSSGKFDEAEALSARTAVSIANPSSSVVNVTLELRDLQGKPTGLTSQIQLPPRGHTGAFLHELVGFLNMPNPFEGILHVTSTEPGVAVTGLRGRYSELGGFVATTTGPLQTVSGPVVFPHIVNGSGYATKLILLNGGGQAITGSLRFQLESGAPLFIGVVPGNGFSNEK